MCSSDLVGEGVTVGDFQKFVELVLSQPGRLSNDQHTELNAAIEHLQAEANLGNLAAILRCQVALRFDDYSGARTCVNELTKSAPNDPQTVSLQWALAIHDKDKANAQRLLERGREVGIKPAGLARMEMATEQMESSRTLRLVLIGLAVLALGWGLYKLAGRRLFAGRRSAAT